MPLMTQITKPLAVLHLSEKWFAIDAKHIQQVAAYPKYANALAVIETFDDSPSGVVRLQGKTAHAAALIERKVRAEGLVDGESRILIHRQRTSAGAMEVLFTAVPLPVWQAVSGWSQQQRDHCVIFPLAAVASSGILQGQGRVIRCGANLIFFADTREGYFYASVAAYSEAVDDLEIAVRALAQQAADSHLGAARGQNNEGEVKQAPLQVFWCPLYADAAEDERLQKLFAEVSRCRLEDCSQSTLLPLDFDGRSVMAAAQKTALPYLMKLVGVRKSANTGWQRFAALAESWVPVSAAVTAMLALGLFAFGTYQHTAAAVLNASTDAQNARMLQQEQTTRQFEAKHAPDGYEVTQAFVNTLQGSIAGYNPKEVTTAIRSAAGAEIRVLRVRLENIPGKPFSILFDGALRTGVDASAITAFLLELRRAGYIVTPLDPADGGQTGNFTYRMVRVPLSAVNQATATTPPASESKAAL